MPSWKKKISFGLGALLLAASMSAPVWAAANPDFTVGVNQGPEAETTLSPGDTTVVRISLKNQSATALTNVEFSGLKPDPVTGSTLVKAGEGAITCTPTAATDGAVSVTGTQTEGAEISLSGLTVPANGECYVDVPVKAVSDAGAATTVRYAVASGAVSSDQGENSTGGAQGFNVSAISRPTWSKSAVSPVLNGESATLNLKVNNRADIALTGVTFEDIFPVAGTSGAIIEPDGETPVFTPAGCSGAVALDTGAAAKITVTGMRVPANTECNIAVKVKARHSDGLHELQRQNTLSPAGFGSDQGLKPASSATSSVTVKSPLTMSKTVAPTRLASAETGVFTIVLTNAGTTALPVTSFNEASIDGGGVDGVRLTPTAISNSCSGGTAVLDPAALTAGGGFKTGGYDIPANGSCEIKVNFTGVTSNNTPLTFTNSIPDNAVKTTEGIGSKATSATVTLIDELYVDKTQSPSQVAPGNPVRYVVTVNNFSQAPRSTVHVADSLQNGATFLTGIFAGADRSPSLSCSNGDTAFGGALPALGATDLDFVIPTLPAAAGNTPGTCAVTFWALTDPTKPSGTTGNRIAACGVWHGDGSNPANCSGKESNNTTTTHIDPVLVDKTFNGTNYTSNQNMEKPEGTVVTMRIRVRNYNIQTLETTVGDTFPAGLRVAPTPNASSTCGGTIVAEPGTTSLSLNAATVPAGTGSNTNPGICIVQVDVVGPAGSYDNTANVTGKMNLPGRAEPVTFNKDSNVARLTYTGALNATKVFEPSEMTAEGVARVRIRLTNSDASATLTNVAVTDPLSSAKLKLAGEPNMQTSCGVSPVLTGVAGAISVSMSGVTLPPNGSCDLLFDVVNDGSASGNWVNTIPAGNITADGGITNTTPVEATLTRLDEAAPELTKSFNKETVGPGESARLKIQIKNGSKALTGMSVTDYFREGGLAAGEPNGMHVASPANASTTCPGGVLDAQQGNDYVSLSGASMAANEECVVELDVISTNPGTIINRIPHNAMASDQGQTNSGTFGEASLQTSKSITLDKGFTPAVINEGQRSRLRITFSNSTAVVARNFSIVDELPEGMHVPSGPNIQQTCGPNTVVNVSDNTKVQISKGTLPAATSGQTASCFVELDVMTNASGEFKNTIPSKSLKVDDKEVEHPPTEDTLHVTKPLVLHKAIDSKTLDSAPLPADMSTGTAFAKAGEAKVLTLYLQNPGDAEVTQISLIDNLPNGLVVAQTPNTNTNCLGGVVTAPASATSVRLTGASLAAGASCTVTVDVLSNIPGSHVNEIPSGAVSTKEGVTNGEPTAAEVIISTPPSVTKEFSPAVIPANGKSTLTITLNNPNDFDIELNKALVDNLPDAPGTMKVHGTPNVQKTCPGSVTAVANATTITYANKAKIPAGGCTISVDVTADLAGTYNNNIPAGALETDAGSNKDPANAPLKVSAKGFISGKVFADNNVEPNGTFESGTDEPLAGQVVELTGTTKSGDTIIRSTTTDAAGNYLFADLEEGTYTVSQPQQPEGTSNGITTAGTIQSSAGSNGTPGTASNPTGTTSQIANIVLNADGTDGAVSGSIDNNFAEVKLSSISGKVFLDNNNDGNVNGTDKGIPGQEIKLIGTDINGKPVELTTITDADGNYRFDDLLPGNYEIVQPDQPEGTSNGKAIGGAVPNDGTSGTGSNPEAGGSKISGIVLPPNTQSNGNNFAELPENRSISGQVFLDNDKNGLKDGEDKGIGGQKIQLTGEDVNGNTIVRETTTDADGNYRFDNLPEGTYDVIQPNQPVGTTNADAKPGPIGSGTANNPTDTSSEITGIKLTGSNTTSVENNFPEEPGDAPDLKIVKESATDMVAAGSTVPGIFTLTPSNIGKVDTEGLITIVDNLPEGMTLAEPASGNGWNCPNPAGSTTLSCTTNNVIEAGEEGAKITVKVLVAASASGKILVNTAEISGGGELEGFVGPENKSSAQVSAAEPAKISGTVWRDINHDGKLDGNEPPVEGVRVVLTRDGVDIASAITGEDGKYSFEGLPAGTGYDLRFEDLRTGTVYMGSQPNETGQGYTPGQRDVPTEHNTGTNNGNPAGATVKNGALTGMTLLPGDDITQQSLPLDPSGVVYDALTREPVSGAVVTISGPPGFNPSQHLTGGQATQTTGADGMYQFWLTSDAPVGDYNLTVSTYPAGYIPAPSTIIPVCSPEHLDVSAGANKPELIQASPLAPGSSVPEHEPESCVGGIGPNNTQHYFTFRIDPAVSGNVVNNHIPLDPVLGGAIIMTKTTPKVNVVRGEMVPYVLTATNTLAHTLFDVAVEDQIPPGFKYVKGSSQVEGVPREPVVNGRNFKWSNLTLNPGQKLTFKMLLVVGTGVGYNEYINQTWAMNEVANSRISNVATATVRVVADPTFECSDLIGTVYDDKNRNGYQDKGEPGLPGVRVATPKGWLVTTDNHGRYHIACADVPNEMRGGNFIVKVDERTLPSGYRVVTENPRVVRLSQGRLVKANFGASIHRVVRLDLTPDAFDGKQLKPGYQEQMSNVMQALHAEPSILRIAYRLPVGEKPKVARERIKSVTKWVKKNWEPQECCYDLQLEEEIVPAIDSVEVVR